MLVFQHRKYTVQCLDIWISGRASGLDKRLSCALGPPMKADSTCRVHWLMMKREDSKAGKPCKQHISLLGFSCCSPLTFSRVLHGGGFPRLSLQLTLEATFPSSAGFCSRCTAPRVGQELDPEVTCPFVLHLWFRVRLQRRKLQLLWSSYLGALCLCFPIQSTGNNTNTHEQWQRPFD